MCALVSLSIFSDLDCKCYIEIDGPRYKPSDMMNELIIRAAMVASAKGLTREKFMSSLPLVCNQISVVRESLMG